MTDKLTLENIAQLRAPFDLSEYEAREGLEANSGKVRWFIYVRREAIINRLDDVFPGEWSDTLTDQHVGDGFASTTCAITIRGITRQLNGSNSGNSEENNIKGAATDAFKRASSMWGIGLHLQSSPTIWTDGGYKTEGKNGKKYVSDWDKQRAQEKEAISKFGRWLNVGKQPPVSNSKASAYQNQQAPPNVTRMPQAENNQPTDNGAASDPSHSNGYWTKEQVGKTLEKFNARFPQSHHLEIIPLLDDDKISDISDFPDERAALVALSNSCYGAREAIALNQVRYVVHQKGKYLQFKVPEIDLRCYGRSTAFKEMVGEDYYSKMSFGRFDNVAETTPWVTLDMGLLIPANGYQRSQTQDADGNKYEYFTIGHISADIPM